MPVPESLRKTFDKVVRLAGPADWEAAGYTVKSASEGWSVELGEGLCYQHYGKGSASLIVHSVRPFVRHFALLWRSRDDRYRWNWHEASDIPPEVEAEMGAYEATVLEASQRLAKARLGKG